VACAKHTVMQRAYRCANEAARLTGLHLLLRCRALLGRVTDNTPFLKTGRNFVRIDALDPNGDIGLWSIALTLRS
jgi:hypothetical protein